MSLVVDTSIIIAVLTNEKKKSSLIRATEGEDLLAPSSLHWEIWNAFSAMFKRNRITLDQAKKAMDYYSLIPLRFQEVDISNALEIANNYDIYAYDAYFLECSMKNNSPLITLDESLKIIAKQMKIKVIEV
jgi:predicted nucleic acid-binding protein